MKDNEMNLQLYSLNEVTDATAVNRRALRRLNPASPVNVDMKVKVLPDIDSERISIVVTCSYTADIYLIRTHLAVCSVVATFEVEDLKSYIEYPDGPAGAMKVATPLMSMMLGIAVGALRGIMAVRLAGTPLSKHPMPIISMAALIERLSYTS